MEHESKKVAIVGGGASGCLCAYFLLESGIDVTIWDKGLPLRTILPTGGGRCNLAHAEYDFKELVKNYPRGEKFLYSVFSRFSTSDTLSTFEKIGIKTYTQDDGRIFPVSNDAKDVREKLLYCIKNAKIEIAEIAGIEYINRVWNLKTLSAGQKEFSGYSDIVIATGGHSGYDLLKNLGINIIEPKPSLVGLNTKEITKNISGTVIKNVCVRDLCLDGDLLFTHFGISGPLVYKISSLKARDHFPYKIIFDVYPQKADLQEMLNSNPHKKLKNVMSEFMPQKFVSYITGDLAEIEACNINGKTRNYILNRIHNFEITVTGTNNGEETVTAGGIDLSEIDSRTMQSKKYSHLYCIGEVLDIDGFCGGFNLQNAWSTAFVAAEGILSHQ